MMSVLFLSIPGCPFPVFTIYILPTLFEIVYYHLFIHLMILYIMLNHVQGLYRY